MRIRRIEHSRGGGSLGGGDLINVFLCLWVLIINVRMGLNLSIRLFMGPLCGTLSWKCGTSGTPRTPNGTLYRIRRIGGYGVRQSSGVAGPFLSPAP